MRKLISLFTSLLCTVLLHAQQPTQAQLAWHETEFYFFLHFGPNTFTDLEWGHGTETEDMFNPTDLDCDQWCKVALSAGAKGLIITAKHHDGFCLWPSAYSKHTVRESKWKNGQGDVLRELSNACKRNGLKLGFYLSPWDRNHPQYGTPEYNDIYVATMTELMTQYGDLFEFWWDGANGEGPNGKKQVYDFHRFEREAVRLQPNAVIFSDIGPGCRWAGNEQGTVGETNWCTLDTVGFQRGAGGPPAETLQQGNENGAVWIPAECDVSIRPGWFYHANEDTKVKSPEVLWDLWLKSVGRNANLILNVPPDRTGRIHPRDSAVLAEFGRLRMAKMGHNLVQKTSTKRTTTDVILKNTTDVQVIKIQENIKDGQHIKTFSVKIWDESAQKWQKIHQGTTIGYRRILELPQAVRTNRLRVEVLSSRKKGKGKINNVEVYEPFLSK